MSHARLDVKLFTLLPSFFLPFKCYSEDTGVSGSDKGTKAKNRSLNYSLCQFTLTL